MTPNKPTIPGADVKVTPGGGASTPLPKCPTMFGVIDMLTPPWLPARPGSRRGYCDPLNEFQGIDFRVESGWAKADKSEVNWDAVKRRAKAYPRGSFIGIDIEHPWEHDYRKTDAMHALTSRNLICRVVAEMKGQRPDLIIGVYATVPNLYWESLNPVELAKWQKAAEFCAEIVKVVDVVMPVSYLHYDRDDDNDDIDIASDAINMNNEVGLTMKMYPDKPYIPWVSAKIYDGAMTKSRDVSPHRWRAQHELLMKLGCAGVGLWGYNSGQLPGIHESILFDEAIKIWGGKAAA